MELDGARTLAWRLGQHALVPPQQLAVAGVLDRVVATRAWPTRLAEDTIRARQTNPVRDGLAAALAAGDVITSYSFRGGSYLFTPTTGADLLAVRTASKIWATTRWQQQGSFAIEDWEPLREAVREACADGPRTRDEIAAHVVTVPGLQDLADGLAGAGADSLYKPLHWWGDICFAPSPDGVARFRWLRDDPSWPGLPPVPEAGPRAVATYVHAYGPARRDNLHYWLTEGLGAPKAMVTDWIASLSKELTTVTVDGDEALVLTADVDAIADTVPDESLLLLPGFDPWLMGPGTFDTTIMPSSHRALASRGANPVVLNGVVAGVWALKKNEIHADWFAEAGPIPTVALEERVEELRAERGDELVLTAAQI